MSFFNKSNDVANIGIDDTKKFLTNITKSDTLKKHVCNR